MYNEHGPEAEAWQDIAAQQSLNEPTKEEFNFKLAGQIEFVMSQLNDLSVSLFNSLIAQTDGGKSIGNDLLTAYHKLEALKEGLV